MSVSLGMAYRMTTAHDLAANWEWRERYSGFQLSRNGVMWEEAEYLEEEPYMARVRIGRVIAGRNGGVRAVVRYVSPRVAVLMCK